MYKKFRIFFLLFLAIPGLILTASCTKKPVLSEQADMPQYQDDAYDSDTSKSTDIEESGLYDAEKLAQKTAIQEAKEKFLNENIYFGFDKASLSMTAQEKLMIKASWMQNNPSASIIIEGHCDERGTTEYNIALGDKRAEKVKSFMMELGVDDSRIQTVSYGEESPADLGHNENAWQLNRRAHFTLK